MKLAHIHPQNDYVLSVSGKRISLNQPDQSSFLIEDIAHSLSMIPRFNGNLRKHYSVAQHSVLVSRLVPKQHAFRALMHDASEFALGDMSSPLKAKMPAYRKYESRMQDAIHRAFGIATACLPAVERLVKTADLQMLAAEKAQLMPFDDGPWSILEGVLVPDIRIRPMGQRASFNLFMNRFRDLVGQQSESARAAA